ncbi:MAG: hypothetical protein WBG73_15985 [Coleofasciculaceae cyanobacterium]
MLNTKHRLNRKEAMVNPFDPERDEMPFEDENDPFSRTLEDFTLTGKLRRFHEHFDSSIRAILQDCLFRIQEENGALTFQILCPNEIIQKRLYIKREKIRNTLRWIWGDLEYYALCVEKDSGLQCRIMDTQRYKGGI